MMSKHDDDYTMSDDNDELHVSADDEHSSDKWFNEPLLLIPMVTVLFCLFDGLFTF